jgi:hypothetical protein
MRMLVLVSMLVLVFLARLVRMLVRMGVLVFMLVLACRTGHVLVLV